MSRELMQQALEALEAVRWSRHLEDARTIAKNARYSLRQAIEEAELAKPEQEPVNTMPTKIVGPNLEQILNAAGFYKREWVGLTDKERNEMIGRIQHDQYTRQRDLIGKTQIITEMYLKEKNT